MQDKCALPVARVRLLPVFPQAIDDDCNQTGQMLAALLEWPQVSLLIPRAREGGGKTALLLLPYILAAIGLGDIATESNSGKEGENIGRDAGQSSYNLPNYHTLHVVLC